MKCQMCNGEGGKIPHPENYGSYREDCPACHGTGKQLPVGKKLLRYRLAYYNESQRAYVADDFYMCSDASPKIESIESELSEARGEIERLKARVEELEKQSCEYEKTFTEFIATSIPKESR